MADRVWKRVDPKVIGRSKQLSLNRFFDWSITFMRKGRNGETIKIMEIMATNVVAN